MEATMKKWLDMTPQQRVNEPGTMSPCPFCQKPRVERSDYIRCNHCGVNWLDGEDVTKNPTIERMKAVVSSGKAHVASVSPTASTSRSDR